MYLINRVIVIIFLGIFTSFSSDGNKEFIIYNTSDYLWDITLSNGFYSKHKLVGDRGTIMDSGFYQIDEKNITIFRTKNSSVLFSLDSSRIDTIIVPNKDTIRIDGLKYYREGGLIKPPKIKWKRK